MNPAPKKLSDSPRVGDRIHFPTETYTVRALLESGDRYTIRVESRWLTLNISGDAPIAASPPWRAFLKKSTRYQRGRS